VPPLVEGEYAAHTRKANSYAIGIGICAMSGAKTQPLIGGKYPVTKAQWETAVSLIAALAHRYNIPVTEKTILTHAEIQPNLGIWQRGKWDIAWLPFWTKTMSAKAVGDKLRAEVKELV
jgi:N-acetyl-anhydromuramyl-L-alanine amidase AmpD